jgi:dTMP kinase
LLLKFLKSQKFITVYTREPGGTRIGSRIRDIILDKKCDNMSARCELFLYLADRNQNVCERVLPALRSGKIVVSDRYSDATLAYQGYGRGQDIGLLRSLNRIATFDITPDLTILLDIDIKKGLSRAILKSDGNGDRLELEKKRFHESVRKGYLKIWKQNMKRFHYIKVSGRDIESIQSEIRSVVISRLRRSYG